MESENVYQLLYTIFFIVMSIMFGVGLFDGLKKHSAFRVVGNFMAMSFSVFACLVRFGIITKY